MTFLLDSNVISELRPGRRNQRVVAWFEAVAGDQLVVSALTIGELRFGVESLRHRDPHAAEHLERWIDPVIDRFSARCAVVTPAVAQMWARLRVPNPVPFVDAVIAATALVNDWTVVTRNVSDFSRYGVRLVNPWQFDG